MPYAKISTAATESIRIYLPVVHGGGGEVSANIDKNAIELANALIHDERQMRTTLLIDDRLMELAMMRAVSFANGNEFGHVVVSGNVRLTVNEFIRASDYPLPSWYAEKGNNCESLCLIPISFSTPKQALDAWAYSEGHANHVFGRTEFFAGQTHLGVGFAASINKNENYWVVLTSHMEG